MLSAALSLAAWSTIGRAEVAVPSANSELAPARLCGASRYTYWGFDIYQARLWAESADTCADLWRNRFVLELEYQRDFKGRDIAQRSMQEMQRQGRLDEPQATAWLQNMVSVFPDVGKGDRLSAIYLPGQGIRFLANGKLIGEVNDLAFAQRFLGIWLSEKTSEPQMRLALLGRNARPVQP
jgi:hypothetical protein